MKYYRVRIRKQNGRTEIIPVRFRTREEAQSFADKMNAENNGYKYEFAGCKHCY